MLPRFWLTLKIFCGLLSVTAATPLVGSGVQAGVRADVREMTVAFASSNAVVQRAAAQPAICGVARHRVALRAETEPGIGFNIDPTGAAYVDVQGDYIDDGYVDDEMPAYRQGSGKGLFGGFFGGNSEEKQKAAALAAQREREMNVIQFVDPDATPGLMHKRPSYFDPDIVGDTKQISGLYRTSLSSTNAPKITARTPLPAGWYAAKDEATGKEYYYTAEGEVTWQRPQ